MVIYVHIQQIFYWAKFLEGKSPFFFFLNEFMNYPRPDNKLAAELILGPKSSPALNELLYLFGNRRHIHNKQS